MKANCGTLRRSSINYVVTFTAKFNSAGTRIPSLVSVCIRTGQSQFPTEIACINRRHDHGAHDFMKWRSRALSADSRACWPRRESDTTSSHSSRSARCRKNVDRFRPFRHTVALGQSSRSRSTRLRRRSRFSAKRKHICDRFIDGYGGVCDLFRERPPT